VFLIRQKNAAIPAIRAVVNFSVTMKFLENCQILNFWRLSDVKRNFFSFVKKGLLNNRRDNLKRVFPSANPRWG
jgi:hypothetical protein